MKETWRTAWHSMIKEEKESIEAELKDKISRNPGERAEVRRNGQTVSGFQPSGITEAE